MGGKTQAMRMQVEEEAHVSRPRWFVVESRHQRERRAKDNLVRQRFEVYLPMRFCARKDDRLPATPFLPGFLFVRFDPEVTQWLKIMSTDGVHSLIINGQGKPQAFPDAEIERIKKLEEDGVIHLVTPPAKFIGAKGKKGKTQPVFHPGDKVTVTAGPFAGADGLVHVMNDKDRVTLFLSLAHRAESVLKVQLQSRALSAPALR